MEPIQFSVPVSKVFFNNEQLEDFFISTLSVIFIGIINTVIVIMLRHRGEINQLHASNYFDMIAYHELFSAATWQMWLGQKGEFDVDKATRSPKPSSRVATRRMIKSILLHSLVAGLQVALLFAFSRQAAPLLSDHVGVVVKYADDSLTKVRFGSCITSTPESRREQLRGVFMTCVSVSSPEQELLNGTVRYAFGRGGSVLLINYTTDSGTINSKIQFRYVFEQELAVKLDENLNEVFMQYFLDAAAKKNCTLPDPNEHVFTGCEGLDVMELGVSSARSTGFVGGNSTFGLPQNLEEQEFVEELGLVVGSFSATKLRLTYLPVVVGISIICAVVIMVLLPANPQAIINLLIMEKIKVRSDWGYLFVDNGSVTVRKWVDDYSGGYIGTEVPPGAHEVPSFGEGIVMRDAGIEDSQGEQLRRRGFLP